MINNIPFNFKEIIIFNNLTLREQKMLCYIISKIDKTKVNDDSTRQIFDISIENNKPFCISNILEILKKIVKANIKGIFYDDAFIELPIFEKIEFNQKRKFITVTMISQSFFYILPLIDITKSNIDNFLKFKSKHSIPAYYISIPAYYILKRVTNVS